MTNTFHTPTAHRQTISYACRRRVHHYRARHCGHRPGRTGQIKIQEEVEIVGLNEKPRKTVVTGVEMFRKILDSGQAGDNVGCLLRGRPQRDRKGPGAGQAREHQTTQELQSKCICIDQRRRRQTHPFFNGYRPHSTSVPPTLQGNNPSRGRKWLCPGSWR